MPTVKQRTVDGRTYRLEKAQTHKDGAQYEYYVTEDGGPVEDPVYTRADGDRQFRETIRLVKQARDTDNGGGLSLPGMGGGGGGGGGLPGMGGGGGGGSGPSLPGIGGPNRGDDDDDDEDGPSLPFF